MTVSATIKGTLLATTVAGMFACATTQQPTAAPVSLAGGEVKCEGINECKGKTDCGGGVHHCAAQNESKGKGWLKAASKQECEAKGGKAL